MARNLEAIARNQRQRELFYRNANRVRNENAKREKIAQTYELAGGDMQFLAILGVFMPAVNVRTILAGIRGEKLPMPELADDLDALDLIDPN